ncbi:uncharacterized protein IUM83_04405 [Phytophthora cinnamomi]|uniref:uncharacterized protein n=1 Tax=Phytophthora cinnamomi TaxID=4785 RepID=UPI003559F8E9|nr:hypothetical protein IUM83_04405 [Phytophthora cinnamomi]
MSDTEVSAVVEERWLRLDDGAPEDGAPEDCRPAASATQASADADEGLARVAGGDRPRDGVAGVELVRVVETKVDDDVDPVVEALDPGCEPQRPSVSAHSAVGIPATGAPIPSLSGLLQDAYDLEYEARTLRARFDMALALNAGLACHASVLHDRNLARLQRAREGYQLGASTVNRLHEQLEGLQLENARLEDVAAGLQTPAVRADEYETRSACSNRPHRDLLTTHAEERQSDLDRIRDLEASTSGAETARVAAQADLAHAQAAELQSTARSARYRSGWLHIRRTAAQQRDVLDAQARRVGPSSSGCLNVPAFTSSLDSATPRTSCEPFIRVGTSLRG